MGGILVQVAAGLLGWLWWRVSVLFFGVLLGFEATRVSCWSQWYAWRIGG